MTCTKCGVRERSKSSSRCYECERERNLARYESRKKYIAEWKRSRPERVRRQNYEASIRSKEKYPYKVAARLLLNRAVARGEMERPEACSSCGAGGRIHGHHEDYKKPLEVVWLCRKCHCELHSKPRTPPVEVEATGG